MKMSVFLYRWKIKSGKEKQFEENWSLTTKAIAAQCGSYGSRLHIAESGEYFAYAQWPDAATREKCELDSSAFRARSLMREAVEYAYPDEHFAVKVDLLKTKYDIENDEARF